MKCKELLYPKKKSIPFTELTDGIIQCQGTILKRLNRRTTNKNTILEYYKCYNSLSKHKHAETCKFSGKLVYNIHTRPSHLIIIKQHSLNCSHNEILKKVHQHKTKLNLNILPSDHFIYNEGIAHASISIQIKKEKESRHRAYTLFIETN